MKFEITILGSGAATPTLNRNPSGQYVYVNERHFLMDCGEGTQIQLRKHKVKFQKINHIFISHLHGDHYLGLMGFLSSLHLLGRTKKMTIFSPPGLKEIILIQLRHSKTYLSFEIEFIELEHSDSEVIFEDELVSVSAFPLNHRVRTYGYHFAEKQRPNKIKKEAISEYNISLENILKIKSGEDLILEDGSIVPNSELTIVADEPKSYAYCSDTKYKEEICTWIKNVTAVYHEATFIEKHLDRASKTYHSTAKQAATIALKSDAKQLLLGHFSARYPNTAIHLKEAKEIFSNTYCVEDGDVFRL